MKASEGLFHYARFAVVVLIFAQRSQAAPDLLVKVSSGEEVLVISEPAISFEVGNDIGSSDGTVPKLRKSSDVSTSPKSTKPEIYSFRIHSDVQYRYSRTYVTSRVVNKDMSKSQEVTFRVVLPETAFISKFIMEIDGTAYEAYVKEKEEAKRVYNEAQSQGQSAGLVELSTRNSNTFNVNVNIKAQSKVTFNLTYEELLSRRLGRYEQVINISPEQFASVKDFQVSVNIVESQNITYLRVPSLRNDIEADEGDAEGNNKDAIIIRPAGNKANISWTPSVEEQEALSKQGVGGKFVVQYDVSRESTSGEILVMQGYFVHFFAPENLRPLRKHVVFILDISGSMWGRKMEQLKESQKKILEDLSPDDFFNIITFSSDVFLWSPNDQTVKEPTNSWPSYHRHYSSSNVLSDENKKQPYPATKENIAKAKSFIDSLVATGGTNIHDSIITAINLTSAIKDARDGITKKRTQIGQNEEDISQFEPLPTAIPMGGIQEVTTLYPSEIETTMSPEIEDILSSSNKNRTILPKNVESLIIFLTDGEPTVGITDPPYIQQLIQAANRNLTLPIFSLGFGEGADFPFLKKLSLQNYGFGRKIYEASDAALQLKGFYNEIASPLLSNVQFNYTSPEYNITDVTVTRFPTVFGGTEIAVSGKLVATNPRSAENVDAEALEFDSENGQEATTLEATTSRNIIEGFTEEADAPMNDRNEFVQTDRHYLDVAIAGSGRDGIVGFDRPMIFCKPIDEINFRPFPPRPTPPPTPEDQFLERLWAYLTIQQLIEEDLKEGDSSKNREVLDEDLPDLPLPLMPELSDKLDTGTTVVPSVRVPQNSTKNLTPKQKAVQLALKYSFVTPFTSLVVVKPNSSDVTNAIPTDARPEALDSLSAPQSMHAAFIQPAVSLKLNGVANRIAGGPQSLAQSYMPRPLSAGISAPNYLSGMPSPPLPYLTHQQHKSPVGFNNPGMFTTRAPAYNQRPTRPQAMMASPPKRTSYGGSSSIKLSHPPPPVQPVLDSYAGYEIEEEVKETTEAMTTEAPAISTRLTLDDIKWFRKDNISLRLNGREYIIAINDTIGADATVGQECSIGTVKGQCMHLKDCVQPEFIADMGIFTDSYFCSIKSMRPRKYYAGSCCVNKTQRSLDFEDP